MDNHIIDLKNIWQQQKVNQPDIKEFRNKLKQFKHSGVRKLIISNILLIATTGLILFIWYYFQPQLITSKIGIILVVLAMVMYLFFYNKLFSVFNLIDNTQSNNGYLHSLNSIKVKQKYIQTTILNLYFVLLSLGICLYLYEYTSIMTSFWAVFTYAITFIWLGFNWFYIRPKTIKKQRAKVEELIGKLEALNKQLTVD